MVVARMVQHEARLVWTIWRSRVFPGLANWPIDWAILALPLSTSQGYQGAMWIAYRDPHAFTDSELGFMATVAGQASVLIEHVQLFEAAEGGRRRLAAILASTSDAVIVTDREDRILLLNPAAEADFELSASQTMGQPVSDVFSDAGLVSLLTADGGKDMTREVQLPVAECCMPAPRPSVVRTGIRVGEWRSA